MTLGSLTAGSLTAKPKGRTPGLSLLFGVLVVAFVVTAVIVVLIVLYGGTSRIAQRPDVYAALFGALGLVLGTSAAVASAVATVKLAGTAVVISEGQRNREVRDFLERRVDSVIDVYVGVCVALSEVFVQGMQLQLLVQNDIQGKDPLVLSAAPLPPEFALGVGNLKTALLTLDESLQRIQRNPLAARCFARTLAGDDSYLGWLGEQMQAQGFTGTESLISHQDITEMTRLMSVARDRLSGNEYSALIAPFTAARMPEAVQRGYDHAALRSLAFTGNLIYSFVGRSKDTGAVICAAYGVAVLRDIYRSLPSPEVLRRELGAAYPELAADAKAFPISFRPADIAGQSLVFALDALAERRDILFIAKT